MKFIEKLEDVQDFIESQVDDFRAQSDYNERCHEVIDVIEEMQARGESDRTITKKIAKMLTIGVPSAVIIIKALTGVWIFGWLL